MVSCVSADKDKRYRRNSFEKAEPPEGEGAVCDLIDLKSQDNCKRTAGEGEEPRRANKETDVVDF